MDKSFYIQMLEIDSTTGRERAFADFLAERMSGPGRKIEKFEVESMKDADAEERTPVNLLVSWGEPKLVFCTHLDTVPPYIPPREDSDSVAGRGTADAKGQIFSMWEASKILEAKGYSDFGLLLLAGEETGSFGAKAFSAQCPGADFLVVGEPTDNHMVSASKGTKSYEVEIKGKAFHSGYPEYGLSAVEMFNDFMNALRSIRFPNDDILGETTWNIGQLSSDNPQNIISDKITFRLYFRTTFESDQLVQNIMKNIAGQNARLRFGRPKAQDGSDVVAKDVARWQECMTVTAFGGDAPTEYMTIDGFPVKPVSFGSDAPHLTRFKNRMIFGPGSILVAHRDDEHLAFSDIEKAVEAYVRIYEYVKKEKAL